MVVGCFVSILALVECWFKAPLSAAMANEYIDSIWKLKQALP